MPARHSALGALTIPALALAALALPAPASAQAHDHEAHTPYAGLEAREIRALSPEEVASLLEGEGMGLALAAELNGIPGPLHVLELREPLALDSDQEAAVTTIFDAMRARARALGESIVELERTLDLRFRHAHIDAPTVRELTGEIARLQGELRAVHLEAHLELLPILTDDQVAAYVRLRGYAPPGGEAALHPH